MKPLLLSALVAVGASHGQDFRSATADNLNTTGAWADGSIPTTADIATWNATSTLANTIGAGQTYGGLNLSAASGAVSISGAFNLGLDHSTDASTVLDVGANVFTFGTAGAGGQLNILGALSTVAPGSGNTGTGATFAGSGVVTLSSIGTKNWSTSGGATNGANGVTNLTFIGTLRLRGVALGGAGVNQIENLANNWLAFGGGGGTTGVPGSLTQTGAFHLDTGDSVSRGDFIITHAFNDKTLELASLAGTGNIRADLGVGATLSNRGIRVNQSSDTVFSGGIYVHNGSGQRRNVTLTKDGSGKLTFIGRLGSSQSVAGNPASLNFAINGGVWQMGDGTENPSAPLNGSNWDTASTFAIGSAGTLRFMANATEYTWDRALSGTGAIEITNDGTPGEGNVTLTGNNIDFTGTTTVSAGRLRIGGQIGSRLLTVSSGGTIEGNGSIAGSVNVGTGAKLSPGNGVGNLTVGSLDIDAGSLLDYDFSGSNDLITAGAVNIDGGSVALYHEGTTNPFSTPGTYNLIAYTSLTGDPALLTVSNEQFGFSYTWGSNGNHVTLTIASTQWTLSTLPTVNGSITGQGKYIRGDSATITATPFRGYLFGSWNGDASGASNPEAVVMDSDKVVGASFIKDNRDSDGDGLTNYEEIFTYGSNPESADTDGDTLDDGDEIDLGRSALGAEPVVSNLNAVQRAGTNFVDISYDVTSDAPLVKVTLLISSDGGNSFSVPVTSVNGAVGVNVSTGRNKLITWDAGVDWLDNFSPSMRFKVVVDSGNGGARISSLEFSFIPDGVFTMGASGSFEEEFIYWVFPKARVGVSGFGVGKYEVTKELWDSVRAWGLGNGYSDLPEGWSNGVGHPVTKVSWFDVLRWCNARSEMEGLNPCYVFYGEGAPIVNWESNGYRLPTEAEWEKAARGGVEGKAFPWAGDEISFSDANFYTYWDAVNPNFSGGTSPIGGFSPNGYGLFDVAGNVMEWCWDGDDGANNIADYDGVVNPRGPQVADYRVARGGAYNLPWYDCRCASRDWRMVPNHNWDDNIGFRLAAASGAGIGYALSAVAFVDTRGNYLSVIAHANGSIAGAGFYHYGTSATITATAFAGYRFTGWTDDASGSTNPLTITMEVDKTVGATFEKDFSDSDNDGLAAYDELLVYGTNPALADSDGDGLSDGYELGIGRFSIVPGSFTWQQARTDARSKGGDLASFPTEDRWNRALQNLAANPFEEFTGLWIGASDATVDGTWVWVNGQTFSYARWGSTRPSSTAGNSLDFAEVSGGGGAEIGKWYDRSSTTIRDGYLLETGYASSPTVADTDGDGLSDGQEVNRTGTNPLLTDTNGDGIPDSDTDQDADGLTAYEELVVYGTDPTLFDTDGDGLSDGYELGIGRFSIVTGSFTWQQARTDARSKGGELASFPNEDRWNRAMQGLGANPFDEFTGLWIGASDAAVDGTWVWVNGETFSFAPWGTGRPSSTAGNTLDFAEVSGGGGAEIGQWYDRSSTTVREGYILESGYATSPLLADTDGDGVNDGLEAPPGPTTTPAAPTALVATPGDGRISIAFTAGADGGALISNYQFSIDNGTNWTAFSPVTTVSPVIISGLTNGTTYNLRLRAVNTIGAGAASDTATGTPVADAEPPIVLSGRSKPATMTSISASKLASRASSVFGTAATVASVDASSEEGGTVVLAGSVIQYTPEVGFAGVDRFRVTFSYSGGELVGLVEMTTTGAGSEPSPSSSLGVNPGRLTPLSNGRIGIQFNGIPGVAYQLQRSTDLVSWTTVATITAGSRGEISYTDENPPSPNGFYRLSTP